MRDIGFIGLGIMGAPMAGQLQAGGHRIFTVKHRSPLPQPLLEGGAGECATPKEVAEKSEIVITMVPDTPQVEAILFAARGVAEGLGSGKIVVDMSSVSPIETKGFCRSGERLRLRLSRCAGIRR